MPGQVWSAGHSTRRSTRGPALTRRGLRDRLEHLFPHKALRVRRFGIAPQANDHAGDRRKVFAPRMQIVKNCIVPVGDPV